MAYKVIILYRLYMPSYFLGTFTEYPIDKNKKTDAPIRCIRFFCFYITGINESWYWFQEQLLPLKERYVR